MGLISWQPKKQILSMRSLFNIYLLVGGLSIVVATTVFTYRVSKSVERQSYLTTRLFSDLASRLLLAEDIEQVEPVIELINEIEVPFIITLNSGQPFMWNGGVIGIPMPPFDQLINDNPNIPTHPAVLEILTMAAAFDMEGEPFAIVDGEGKRLGTLHYGQSALSVRIRWMPYLELMIMALFFLVILWALQSRKDAEAKALFAGMAKETAHQLGTPLTSIMGWVAILEEKVGKDDDIIKELNHDVDRLGMVSTRFSQIGSLPKLSDSDLDEVVDASVDYFQRRLPQFGGRVLLRREGRLSNTVVFNRDLLGWVLENLIKNGIDALIDGKGTITVIVNNDPSGGAHIVVADTGKGIPSHVGNKIFEPGFTTKKRGWGMGLALVKRIVTQYHGGKIRVESTSSHGTSIGFVLPSAEVRMTESD